MCTGGPLCEIDLGFGLDDEEDFGGAVRAGAEFAPGFFEGVGGSGVDDFAAEGADKVVVAFAANEFCAERVAHCHGI